MMDPRELVSSGCGHRGPLDGTILIPLPLPPGTHRVEDEGRDGRHERLHGRHEGEELALRRLLHAVGEERAQVRVRPLVVGWDWGLVR